MRRRFLGELLAAAALFTVAGSTASRAASKVLIVGTDASFMPFEFTEHGKIQGFDIDLWAMIAKDLGLDYKLRPMDFSGLIPALQTGNIDVTLSGLTIKPSRAKVIDYSIPYYASGLIACVSVKNTTIEKPADLDGKRIGVKTGTATVDWVRKNVKNGTMLSFPTLDNALLALQAGRVDAVIHDTPSIIYYANTAGKGLVRVVEPPMKSGDYYGIGFTKGSPLVPAVNTELRKLAADGRYKALYMKWFGSAPTFEPK
jgi:glutamine transport system substrate-binding protein